MGAARCLRPAVFLGLAAVSLGACAAHASADTVPFDSARWVLSNARVTEYMGRPCLAGYAYLEGVDFADGVIEVDLAVPSREVRSYPGLVFRMQSEEECERIYVRPHRAPLYDDALQYTPTFKGTAGWQLYSGPGFTSRVAIPTGEWVHLRLEVSGTQARVFLGEGEGPALVIDDLKHGLSRGTIGVMGNNDETSYFADFSYRTDEPLVFDPPARDDPPPGVLTAWEISRAYRLSELDPERTPEAQGLTTIGWEAVTAEPAGLLDIARWRARGGREPDCVYARTTIASEQDRVMELRFGYSDAIGVFLNGELLFFGRSGYQQRDPSFLGIVGLFDALYLPLKRGPNELLCFVAEGFGGWGLTGRDAQATFRHAALTETGEAEGFLTPESIAYDPARQVFYVSNFDAAGRAPAAGGQFLSRLGPDGRIAEREWVAGLAQPTGLAVDGNTLWAAERTGLAEIDIAAGRIVQRHLLPGALFPNDVAVGSDGAVYVSDTRGSRIFRVRAGVCEEWIGGPLVGAPNALTADGDRLLVGTGSDNALKAIDLQTREIRILARLPRGNIDGIRRDGAGGHLVSHWEGRIYRIGPGGEVEKLLDTSAPGVNAADFEYISSTGILVVPTFRDDRVLTYRLGG